MKFRYRIQFVCLMGVLTFSAVVRLVQSQSRPAQIPDNFEVSKNSWYKDSPGEYAWSWPEVPQSNIYEVHQITELKAEQRLARKLIIPLTVGEVEGFLNRKITTKLRKTQRFYLVRSVYFHKSTGGFAVYAKGTKLKVVHGCLGRRFVPMKRQALIVLLNTRPTQVFVTCSMAE